MSTFVSRRKKSLAHLKYDEPTSGLSTPEEAIMNFVVTTHSMITIANIPLIWVGNSRWVQAMEWSGQKEFVASSEVSFEVDGSDAGLLRSHGPLSFLKVCLYFWIVLPTTELVEVFTFLFVLAGAWCGSHGTHGSAQGCTWNVEKVDTRITFWGNKWSRKFGCFNLIFNE